MSTFIQVVSGLALGVGATVVSLLGTWAAIRLMARSFEGRDPRQDPRRARGKAWLLAVVFLAKMPLFLVAAIASYRVGGPGPPCFALGVVLVYCLAIGTVLFPDRSP